MDVTGLKSASQPGSESAIVASDVPKGAKDGIIDVDSYTLPPGHSVGLLTKIIFLFAIAGALVFSVNLMKSKKTAHKSFA